MTTPVRTIRAPREPILDALLDAQADAARVSVLHVVRIPRQEARG